MSLSRIVSRSPFASAARERIARRSVQCPGIRGSGNSASPTFLTLRDMWKPFIFTCGFAGVAYTGASIVEYENVKLKRDTYVGKINALFEGRRRASGPTKNERSMWGELVFRWKHLSDSGKTFAWICAANLVVLGAWRLRPLTHIMMKYFACSTARKPIYAPMVLSMFSHTSPLHFGCNMFVLYTFMPHLVQYLGKEQFMALYLTSGVVSSFSSNLLKVLMHMPGPSVGASGAILGVVAYSCLLHPDNELRIIFFPFVGIPAATALKGLIAVDVFGVLARWKMLDHAAHLGGSLFGVLYFNYGQESYIKYRLAVIKRWHEIKSMR